MTLTLDPVTGADAAAGRPAWRTRLLPLVDARGGWLATLVIGAIAGLLRFVRLDIPGSGVAAEAGTFGRGKIFDEIYYACDAKNLLTYGVERNSVPNNADCLTADGGSFIVHPPLGKWAIALGQWAFGTESSFGWRFSAAVAGTLSVILLVRVARRMTGSTLLGGLAGLLLALDGLHFVQSRVAMLDIFLSFWVLAAFACFVVDRDAVRSRLAAASDDELDGWGPRLGLRPWRLAGGLCLGAAVATKWSALFYIAVLVLVVFAWEVGARRTAGIEAPVRATLVRTTAPLLAVAVVLPAAVYVASWAGWFLTDEGYDRQWAASNPEAGLWRVIPEPDVLRSWWHYHVEIFRFHDGLVSPHPYQSHPIGWLLLARPVSYYYPQGLGPGDYGCTAASCAREVLAIGNPVIWWGSIPVLILCVWLWVSRRDWRAAAVVVMVLTAIVPWVRDDLDDRTMFLFYALPGVPFLCLATALVIGWALGGADATPRRRASAAAATAVYVAAVVVAFAFFYPVLAAQTLPYEAWQDRMWFPSWI
jgi:dolichyl-phosphate-mannose-protein mannosyltransferase